MILTKEQTYLILYQKNLRRAISNKYKCTTKYKWYCLNCGCTLYVGYTCFGRNAIFCLPCYSKAQHVETIAQYQNMRVLKERQLKLVEDYQKKVESNLDKS